MTILSTGFQNKFYNASVKAPGQGSTPGSQEYRISVSCDTPHWYIRDYLNRVRNHYSISAAEVGGKPSAPLAIWIDFYILVRKEGLQSHLVSGASLTKLSDPLSTCYHFKNSI